jgi:hypothetical protein
MQELWSETINLLNNKSILEARGQSYYIERKILLQVL